MPTRFLRHSPLSGLQERACDVLLAVALGKPHQRNVVIEHEAIDRVDILTPDPSQDRRRRDVALHAIQQEPHQLPITLQARHVAGQEDPVDRRHLQGDVIGEQARDGGHGECLPRRPNTGRSAIALYSRPTACTLVGRLTAATTHAARPPHPSQAHTEPTPTSRTHR